MNNSKFKSGVKGSRKALSGFQTQVKKLGGMIAGAFAIGAIVRFGKEAIRLSSQMEGVERAFMNLGRPGLLDELQKATRDTVDNLQLMQSAVKAKNFKIPLENLATYFEFATSRAIQTGESVNYLVDSIINGIGRKSALVLDNLGISAAELQKEIKLVGDFGKAAANIIEREMKNAGDVADTSATQIGRVTTAWTNLTIAVGEKMNSGTGVLGWMTRGAVGGLEDLIKILERGNVSKNRGIVMDFLEAISDKTIPSQIDAVRSRIDNIRKSIIDYAGKYQTYSQLAEESRGKEKKAYEENMEFIYNIQTGNVDLLRIYEEQLAVLERQNIVRSTTPIPDVKTPPPPEEFPPDSIFNNDQAFMNSWSAGMGMKDTSLPFNFMHLTALNDDLKTTQAIMDSLDDLTEEWGDEMAEAASNETFQKLNKINNAMQQMSTMMGVTLVKAAVDMGVAIAASMKGVEASIMDVVKALANNIGYIMMMAGIEAKNWWLVAAGAAVQLGIGISNIDDPSDRIQTSSVSPKVEFGISGANLAATTKMNKQFMNVAT